jgi:hypothetical protein
MKTLRDSCIEYFKNEEIRKTVHEVIRPIFGLIYNEIYIYIWVIAIYHVFLFSGFLALLWILLKVLYNQEKILSKSNV